MAKKLGKRDFYVSSTVVDGYSGASNFNTDSMNMTESNGEIVIYLLSTHTTGSPTATLQVSDDGSNWVNYKDKSILVSLPESFIDSEFMPKFLRVSYTANSSNGNVSFFIAENI